VCCWHRLQRLACRVSTCGNTLTFPHCAGNAACKAHAQAAAAAWRGDRQVQAVREGGPHAGIVIAKQQLGEGYLVIALVTLDYRPLDGTRNNGGDNSKEVQVRVEHLCELTGVEFPAGFSTVEAPRTETGVTMWWRKHDGAFEVSHTGQQGPWHRNGAVAECPTTARSLCASACHKRSLSEDFCDSVQPGVPAHMWEALKSVALAGAEPVVDTRLYTALKCKLYCDSPVNKCKSATFARVR
jgi:hypothetical protein